VREILGLEASSYLDELLSHGLIYSDPTRELNFWRPALKELEEWFDTQKEMRAIAKLDPFFERTSKLAVRRLKRELERRGTLGEPLDGASLFTKRIPAEESASDLFRSDGLDTAALSCHAESPKSVVQGCSAQREPRWAREKDP
jgi:hypothetical protein